MPLSDPGKVKRDMGEAINHLREMGRAFPPSEDTDESSLVAGLRQKGVPTFHEIADSLVEARDELFPEG